MTATLAKLREDASVLRGGEQSSPAPAPVDTAGAAIGSETPGSADNSSEESEGNEDERMAEMEAAMQAEVALLEQRVRSLETPWYLQYMQDGGETPDDDDDNDDAPD
eukprot:gnl/TRDRNA2_/TRDRNA2_147651_c2_seq2.p1 gnl/TRDRNA2_/TRDRNA2_147651_c2~~gnl/TRDRNA2_/TRDRNA2_147651_c2_seq2.p1  ORF type:complete len:107 (+),score=29.82 gnl/TRDRNA2_/TRDRNA2_147651_c2_seq2:25-345(+)